MRLAQPGCIADTKSSTCLHRASADPRGFRAGPLELLDSANEPDACAVAEICRGLAHSAQLAAHQRSRPAMIEIDPSVDAGSIDVSQIHQKKTLVPNGILNAYAPSGRSVRDAQRGGGRVPNLRYISHLIAAIVRMRGRFRGTIVTYSESLSVVSGASAVIPIPLARPFASAVAH